MSNGTQKQNYGSDALNNAPKNAQKQSLNINFDPTQVLKEAEAKLAKEFENTIKNEISAFCDERSRYVGNEIVKTPGAGLLLIRDFLEKKFDDPKTQEMMQKFFEANFERIMTETLEKAIQHRVNAHTFAEVKKTATPARVEDVLRRINKDPS